MKSLTNILERIKLTKEDISGMIREARKSTPGDQVIIGGTYLNGRWPELEMEDIRTLSKLFNSMSKSIVAQNVSEEDADEIISNAIIDINNNRFSIIDFPQLKVLDANMLLKTINNMKSFILDQGFTKDESNRIVKKVVDDKFNGKAQDYARGAEPGRDRSNKNPFRSAEAFDAYIRKRYLSENQIVTGLNALYNEIILSDMSNELENLIISETGKSLKAGEYSISGIEGELYDILKRTVKITNGHETELWFAIVFNGVVVGAKGLTPDVEVGSETISLKDYTETTFDFGTLDDLTSEHLNSFLSLAQLFTSAKLNKSKTRESINAILNELETPEMEAQIKDLLELSKTSKLPVIKNLGVKITSLLNTTNGNKAIHNLVVKFCNEIDRLLEAKIKDASWWGMIIIKSRKLYLEEASSVYNSLKCTPDHRLSDAISTFKGDHMFVAGSKLGSKVSGKKDKG